MKVDLANDRQKIRAYIEQRVSDYGSSKNNGPGQDEDPIRLITLGYYLEQTGYFCLVFDTRPNADSDGHWTYHIDYEETSLLFPEWCSLVEAWYDDETVEITLPSGEGIQVNQESHTYNDLAQVFGEVLRDTMISLRDNGTLSSLPLADDAFLIVEEFDGHWSWPKTYETRKSVRLFT